MELLVCTENFVTSYSYHVVLHEDLVKIKVLTGIRPVISNKYRLLFCAVAAATLGDLPISNFNQAVAAVVHTGCFRNKKQYYFLTKIVLQCV